MRIGLFVAGAWFIAIPARVRGQSDASLPQSPRIDLTLAVTIQTPADVNVRPLCEQEGIYCGSPKTFPDFGLSAASSIALKNWLALVGEAGFFGNHWRVDGSAQGQRTNNVRFVLAGVRVQSRNIRRANADYAYRIFAQLLAGLQASTEVPSGSATQPGLGVDAFFPNGVGVRFQWDYRFVRKEPRDLSGSRGLLGFVIGFP
jgi:hypothetical protein